MLNFLISIVNVSPSDKCKCKTFNFAICIVSINVYISLISKKVLEVSSINPLYWKDGASSISINISSGFCS